MPRADGLKVLRLKPGWRHLLDGRQFPLERVDLLDRLKIFGDVHRTSAFALNRSVVPIYDVTPVAAEDQQPSFFCHASSPAVAAQFSFVALRNPLNSQVLVRPLHWGANSPTSGQAAIEVVVGLTAGAAVVNENFDQRRGNQRAAGVAAGVGFVWVGSNLAAGGAPDWRVQRGTAFNNGVTPDEAAFPKRLIITPGEDLLLISLTLNEVFDAQWAWTEERLAVTRGAG